ncbi:hypothetical protein GW17_00025225 [Ensete ventricosum]|nr:hypothetical protein GW17_00025225 [Ensete ventricosum]
MIIVGLGMCLSLFANYRILVSTSTICIHRCSFTQVWKNYNTFSLNEDFYLQVSCKIINVRSGEELPEKCRELSIHFQTQGTPVMIGK